MSNPSINLPPLRSLNDFLLESARFQLPSQDLEKWGNRVVKNLLYYQTNYFLMSAILVVLVILFSNPYLVLLGIITIGIAVYGSMRYYAATVKRSKTDPPPNKWVIGGGVVGVCYLVLWLFDAVLIVLLAVLLPICGKFFISHF